MARALHPYLLLGACVFALLCWIIYVIGLIGITAVVRPRDSRSTFRSTYGLDWWIAVHELGVLVLLASLLRSCNPSKKALAMALLAINTTLLVLESRSDLNAQGVGLEVAGPGGPPGVVPWQLRCLVAGAVLLSIVNYVLLLVVGWSGNRSLALSGRSDPGDVQSVPPGEHEKKAATAV